MERDSINISAQNAKRVSQKNRYSTGNKKATTMLSTGKCFNCGKLRHKKVNAQDFRVKKALIEQNKLFIERQKIIPWYYV